MPTANAVAQGLRKVAEALEEAGDAEITRPLLYFSHYDRKKQFLALARVFPRPFEKKYDEHNLELRRDDDSAQIVASIRRSVICRLVTPAIPAVYDCDPLLSDDEMASIPAEQSK